MLEQRLGWHNVSLQVSDQLERRQGLRRRGRGSFPGLQAKSPDAVQPRRDLPVINLLHRHPLAHS